MLLLSLYLPVNILNPPTLFPFISIFHHLFPDYLFYPSALRRSLVTMGTKMSAGGWWERKERGYKVCTAPPGAPLEGLQSGGGADPERHPQI